MRISYITTYDAQDVHNWSGLGFNIAQALIKQDHHLEYIGNLNMQPNLTVRLKSAVYNKLLHRHFLVEREPSVARHLARQIRTRIVHPPDVLFAPGSIPLSLVETNRPKVFYTDATFAGMIGFYDAFSSLCPETIRHGNFLEQAALDSSALAIYSSDWAARTAVTNYKVAPEKVKVVPFGANLRHGKSYAQVQSIVASRSSNECHLLFLGVDWKRKGGEMALKITRQLNQAGIKTTLHVAGIKTFPLDPVPQQVVHHGYISKSTPEGMLRIEHLLSSCHFLVLPTLADCTPVVYSEANAFGLPCISTNVGGIPTIIRDDVNGKTFSIEDTEEDYANYIGSLFYDPKRYTELCLSSYNEYLTRLNWEVAGRSISKLLGEL